MKESIPLHGIEGAKVVLMYSVLDSLPTYMTSLFLIPKSERKDALRKKIYGRRETKGEVPI